MVRSATVEELLICFPLVTVVALPSQPCRNICDYARTLCERPFSTYGVVFPTWCGTCLRNSTPS